MKLFSYVAIIFLLYSGRQAVPGLINATAVVPFCESEKVGNHWFTQSSKLLNAMLFSLVRYR
jgi:hypothetical protein